MCNLNPYVIVSGKKFGFIEFFLEITSKEVSSKMVAVVNELQAVKADAAVSYMPGHILQIEHEWYLCYIITFEFKHFHKRQIYSSKPFQKLLLFLYPIIQND